MEREPILVYLPIYPDRMSSPELDTTGHTRATVFAADGEFFAADISGEADWVVADWLKRNPNSD